MRRIVSDDSSRSCEKYDEIMEFTDNRYGVKLVENSEDIVKIPCFCIFMH